MFVHDAQVICQESERQKPKAEPPFSIVRRCTVCISACTMFIIPSSHMPASKRTRPHHVKVNLLPLRTTSPLTS